MIKKHECPPEGFAIAVLPDGHSYPLEAYRLYSASFPDGFLVFHTHDDQDGQPLHFTHSSIALAYCHIQAQAAETRQLASWQRLAVESNCYPDRCAWYGDLIEEMTGFPPLISLQDTHVSVSVAGYQCAVCHDVHPSLSVQALTREDALARAAETVYACAAGEGYSHAVPALAGCQERARKERK